MIKSGLKLRGAAIRIRNFSSTSPSLVTRPITRPNPHLHAHKIQLDDGSQLIVNPPPSAAEAYPDSHSVHLNFNLSDDQISEIKSLRREGASSNALARQFNCSKGLIAVVAPASKQARLEHEQNQLRQRVQWGFNKQLSREQRNKRREYW
ncbi:hypothetical protein E3P99_02730 [Wallemia hederae]|uniref:Uncharacterized protein n=1 Tax=Wallemia hederae TaxID=1540922 RepID=A0A4T0FJ23_9BASI|nr:hypothetical protein E3P99_02730 [Wallemia hederae]